MARVLHLPDHGRLLVATDLQGNLRDFNRIADLYRAAVIEEDGDAHLLFTGDLIHGPHIEPHDWPDFLGDFYRDESPAVVDGFVALRDRFPERVHAILGNHEHAHVGGPHTAKFAPDEVILLEGTLGSHGARRLRGILSELPLVAISPCGIIFTHGAPAADIKSENEILAAPLEGHDLGSVTDIFDVPVIGKILWARSAHPEAARRFVGALGGTVSVFGHDVVPEGYERIGDEQMIVSTSFGVPDANKFYLDLDLGKRYATVHELREGREILPLYPDDYLQKNRRATGS
jgi:hypothetical protein